MAILEPFMIQIAKSAFGPRVTEKRFSVDHAYSVKCIPENLPETGLRSNKKR